MVFHGTVQGSGMVMVRLRGLDIKVKLRFFAAKTKPVTISAETKYLNRRNLKIGIHALTHIHRSA